MESKAAQSSTSAPTSVYEPVPLQMIALQVVTDNASDLQDLRGLGPDVQARLFHAIICRGTLTFRIAKLFEAAAAPGDLVSKCLSELSLLDGVPAYNTAGRQCH